MLKFSSGAIPIVVLRTRASISTGLRTRRMPAAASGLLPNTVVLAALRLKAGPLASARRQYVSHNRLVLVTRAGVRDSLPCTGSTVVLYQPSTIRTQGAAAGSSSRQGVGDDVSK